MTTQNTAPRQDAPPDTPAGDAVAPRVSRFYPDRDAGYLPIAAAVDAVTLLEDRALVCRRGRVSLVAGRNRLLIPDVAPVLQDVSLRAELSSDGPRLVDLRVRRAHRVRAVDKPETARAVSEEIEALIEKFADVTDDRQRAEQRYGLVLEMLYKGMREIPEDAAWGMAHQQVWHDTFETLSKRARTLLDAALQGYFTQADLVEELERLAARRAAFERCDVDFAAWLEVEIDAAQPDEVELSVFYVVPNALWRPLHRAQLTTGAGDAAGSAGAGHRLRWRSFATVWQNTGEDWNDAQLSFSTARSSLGTEPPLLDDDLLTAQRRSEQVVVQRREVSLQRAGLGQEGATATPAGAPPGGVELPGVDDGGEVRNLRASGRSNVPSDGRPSLIPVGSFEAEARCQLVTIAELRQQVLLKVVLLNRATLPILAGPVELIRDSGVVGWTGTLFVAPGEQFELGFGHDDAVRVYRRETRAPAKGDEVDRWRHHDTRTRIYLSNLEGSAKQVEVIERIPVAEIEHVRVRVDEGRCLPAAPQVDDDGFCRYLVTLPPHGQESVQLVWRLSCAPDVEGIDG